jgi:hypothetical protein
MDTNILEEHTTAIFRQKSSKQGKLEGYIDVMWSKWFMEYKGGKLKHGVGKGKPG